MLPLQRRLLREAAMAIASALTGVTILDWRSGVKLGVRAGIMKAQKQRLAVL